MEWSEVTPWAEKYMPYLSTNWPSYVSEMEGIATGAEVPFLDILAMNVRTEIAFGAFSDGMYILIQFLNYQLLDVKPKIKSNLLTVIMKIGCTAIAHKNSTHSILSQNWYVCSHINPHSSISRIER